MSDGATVVGPRELTSALARVSERLTYLRAGVGDVVTRRPGRDLAAGDVVAADELVGQPDQLIELIRHCGAQLGTDDDTVATSLFVQSYAYRVLTLAYACVTTSSLLPDSSASDVAVSLTRGRVSTLHYRRGGALAWADPQRDPAELFRDEALVAEVHHRVVTSIIDEHLGSLIETCRSRVRIGVRLLWGNVAASQAVALSTMEGLCGEWVQRFGEFAVAEAPPQMRGLGAFLLLRQDERRGWFWERTNCCLYDRLPGHVRCHDCSRTPLDERRAAFRASLG